MRNKQQFLDDITPLIKPEYRDELNPVEDAAHCMNHFENNEYVLPKQFSVLDTDTVFLFEKRLRKATDDPTKEVDDYFYIGKEGGK